MFGNLVEEPLPEFFGGGVEWREGELHALGLEEIDEGLVVLMEHGGVIELFDNGANNAADVAEIEDHSFGII